MEENNRSFLEQWSEPLIFAGLAIACIVIYAQTVGFDFINLDDHLYVYLNPAVLSGINSESVKWAFSSFHSFNWHPLTWLSHSLDMQLFGLNPGAYHAVNVILHIVNSCLVFIVFRAYTGELWKSGVVAFLFAVHPMHVESVAWISERKDVLSTVFWLLAMLAYSRYARSAASEGSIARRFGSLYFVLTFVLLALGLMAKPMLVTLPFVLVLLDFWPLKRVAAPKDIVPLLIEKLPLFLLSVASSIVTFMAQTAGGSVIGIERYSIGSRVMNSLEAYAKYVVSMFYPANLGIWYPFEPSISMPEFIGSLVLIVAVTAVAVWQVRTRPYIAFGWFWFLGTLVPVIGLVQVGAQSMADRYTYVPYLGLFVIVVWGLAELIDRFDIDCRVAAAVAAVVILAFGYVAFKQTGYWRNSETLYARTLSVTRNNNFITNLLCQHYIDRTPAENAERRCNELLGGSNQVDALNMIGLLRVELGRYDDALAIYRRALEVRPTAAIVYLNIAVALSKKGDTAQAELHLQRVIDLADPTLSREALAYAYNALGEAYLAKDDRTRARAAFQTAIRYDPRFEAASQNLRDLQGGS